MKAAVLFLAVLMATGSAFGQNRERFEGKPRPGQGMSKDDRQRMREDMRDVYRDRGARPDRPRQMSPEEREKLRRDIQNANKDLKR
jgi:hypothetical protein